MLTFAVVCVMILLLALCGIAPVLLLYKPQPAGRRILLTPILGLCSGILFTYLLASFGMTGRTIAIVTLCFFVIATFLVMRRSRFQLAELRDAAVPLAMCVIALVLTAWPLFAAGYGNYWGYANPDEALYIFTLRFLDSHPFGVPHQSFEQAWGTTYFLGISYFFSMLSVVTGIAVQDLFSVISAAVVFLVPASIYLLCEYGLGQTTRVALAACGVMAFSSIVAYTFYLQSLGALTVIVLLPAGVALTTAHFREPSMHGAAGIAVLAAAFYFCYFPGFALLSVATAAVAGVSLLRRQVRLRTIVIPAFATCILISATFHTQGQKILARTLQEASGGTFDPNLGEIQTAFALNLTEEVVPYAWGLKLPTSPASSAEFSALFGIGLLLFSLFAISFWPAVSRMPGAYHAAVCALAVITLNYAFNRTGYGVFKLSAWFHPFLVAGIVATLLGIGRLLHDRLGRLRAIVAVPLVVYVVLNSALAFRLGSFSLGGNGGGGVHNAPWMKLQDLTRLEHLPETFQHQEIAVILPDPVVQLWSAAFLDKPDLELFPAIYLNVVDSSPRTPVEPPAPLLLHWTHSNTDITPAIRSESAWRAGTVAISRVGELQDALVIGQGWYRKEAVYGGTMAWQKCFRWLRKRGELLLLNPSTGPKRLRATFLAGPGNPAAEREMDLLLNGRKVDTLRFSGFGHVESQPFTVSGPWAQIELVVRQDAEPLPRTRAYWNSWVPRDSRRLNVAASELRVEPATEVCEDYQLHGNMSVEHSKTPMSGIYPDGWVGTAANVGLCLPDSAAALRLEGMLPGVPGFRYPYMIDVSLKRCFGGGSIARQSRRISSVFTTQEYGSRASWPAQSQCRAQARV